MSDTTSTSSSVTAGSGGTLTSLTGSSTLQLTGLSTGLNTDQIIEELMDAKEQPLDALQDQDDQITAQDTELTSLANELDVVANDADAMLDPSLYDTAQTVTSSNAAVTATATTGNGAVEGGYEVQVTQLAQSAQRTFNYTAPTSNDTITIDGQAVTISAGESASSLASSINANNNLDVYATATQSGTLVFSERDTGQQTGDDYIQVSDPGGALVENAADANAGQNATYMIGSTEGSSASDTVTDAIPGVTLTLNALTTGSSPVTVDVGAPTINTSSIETAVQQFITDYNSTITDIQTQLSTTPADTNGTETGTLYDDEDLTELLSTMRDALVATVSGTDSGLTNLTEIGISTGATTGDGTVSTSALEGDLTLDTSTLTSALESNPTGVQQLLTGWANSFATLVSNEAAGGGTISQRINDNESQLSDLSQQITDMQASLTDQENQLVQQYAALESAESSSSSEESWLTDQESTLNADS